MKQKQSQQYTGLHEMRILTSLLLERMCNRSTLSNGELWRVCECSKRDTLIKMKNV